MCNLCEPNGWKRKCCNIHGAGTPAYISIAIATDNDDELYPYTMTDLCKKCFDDYGVESAINHNEAMRKEPK